MKRMICAAILAGSASPGLAEIDASDPTRINLLFLREGFSVQLGSDGVGDPKITGKLNGTEYELFFYDCKDNQNCRTLQFQVGYNLRDGLSLKKANEWNAKMRYGTVFVDEESDPHLQMDVNIDYGVSEENLVDNLKLWTKVMGQFEEYIGW